MLSSLAVGAAEQLAGLVEHRRLSAVAGRALTEFFDQAAVVQFGFVADRARTILPTAVFAALRARFREPEQDAGHGAEHRADQAFKAVFAGFGKRK